MTSPKLGGDACGARNATSAAISSAIAVQTGKLRTGLAVRQGSQGITTSNFAWVGLKAANWPISKSALRTSSSIRGVRDATLHGFLRTIPERASQGPERGCPKALNPAVRAVSGPRIWILGVQKGAWIRLFALPGPEWVEHNQARNVGPGIAPLKGPPPQERERMGSPGHPVSSGQSSASNNNLVTTPTFATDRFVSVAPLVVGST